MRGLQTPVRAIRRQVFTEVAKLGFKANAETLVADMEAIPYEIVGEDSEVKYRESIYRARAVVRERLRLAMGLSLRPENKPVHLTAGVEASNISEKYYEPPLMQIGPDARAVRRINTRSAMYVRDVLHIHVRKSVPEVLFPW